MAIYCTSLVTVLRLLTACSGIWSIWKIAKQGCQDWTGPIHMGSNVKMARQLNLATMPWQYPNNQTWDHSDCCLTQERYWLLKGITNNPMFLKRKKHQYLYTEALKVCNHKTMSKEHTSKILVNQHCHVLIFQAIYIMLTSVLPAEFPVTFLVFFFPPSLPLSFASCPKKTPQ